MNLPEKVAQLRDAGALFVVNHSGGKDSQAMFLLLRDALPKEQLLVVHADLPEVDWEGTIEHIEATIGDIPLIVTRSVKTFFQMVEHRQMFPSPKYRQCTSDLKRGPLDREIRRYLDRHPQFKGKVVSCMGERAEESPARAKKPALARGNKGQNAAGREWWTWLPIHDMKVGEVFKTIANHGQLPHSCYGFDPALNRATAMTRMSCCFCMMASRQDLTTAAKLRPELYRRYVETEKRLNFTLIMPGKDGPKNLEQITGIKAA